MSYIFTNPATIPSRVIKPTILTQAILYATQMSIGWKNLGKDIVISFRRKNTRGKKINAGEMVPYHSTLTCYHGYCMILQQQ